MGLPTHRAVIAVHCAASLILAGACFESNAARAQPASEPTPVPTPEERTEVPGGAEEAVRAPEPAPGPVADEPVASPAAGSQEVETSPEPGSDAVAGQPAEAPAEAEPGERYQYRVQAGDTVAAVAEWYGLAPETLAGHLGLDPNDRLEWGTVIELPRGARLLHTVQAAETLSHLAYWYEISVEALMEANGISDARRVRVGDELRVPPGGLRARPPSARRDSWAWERAEREIGEARDRFDSADFEAALSAAQRAEGHIAATDDEARRFRARAFLLQGMALTGLEQRDAARTAFFQARQLDPALTLVSQEVSPKVRELFDEAGTP